MRSDKLETILEKISSDEARLTLIQRLAHTRQLPARIAKEFLEQASHVPDDLYWQEKFQWARSLADIQLSAGKIEEAIATYETVQEDVSEFSCSSDMVFAGIVDAAAVARDHGIHYDVVERAVSNGCRIDIANLWKQGFPDEAITIAIKKGERHTDEYNRKSDKAFKLALRIATEEGIDRLAELASTAVPFFVSHGTLEDAGDFVAAVGEIETAKGYWRKFAEGYRNSEYEYDEKRVLRCYQKAGDHGAAVEFLLAKDHVEKAAAIVQERPDRETRSAFFEAIAAKMREEASPWNVQRVVKDLSQTMQRAEEGGIPYSELGPFHLELLSEIYAQSEKGEKTPPVRDLARIAVRAGMPALARPFCAQYLQELEAEPPSDGEDLLQKNYNWKEHLHELAWAATESGQPKKAVALIVNWHERMHEIIRYDAREMHEGIVNDLARFGHLDEAVARVQALGVRRYDRLEEALLEAGRTTDALPLLEAKGDYETARTACERAGLDERAELYAVLGGLFE